MTKSGAVLLILITLVGTACGPNQRILNSAAENRASSEPVAPAGNAAPPAPVTFEQDLNAMRTADFKFILVFRRKDGQVLDAADKESISRNTPQANRRRLSDNGKAVIIGSNFQFAPMLNELIEKFEMENYSKPDSGQIVANITPIQ